MRKTLYFAAALSLTWTAVFGIASFEPSTADMVMVGPLTTTTFTMPDPYVLAAQEAREAAAQRLAMAVRKPVRPMAPEAPIFMPEVSDLASAAQAVEAMQELSVATWEAPL